MKLLIVALVFLASGSLAGEPTRVRDGDTVVVSNTPVRLKGLSCDENKTEAGKRQTAYLKDWMAKSSSINCQVTGEKSYDREIGFCSLDGVDIGRTMIVEAGCQPCRRYDTEGEYNDLSVTGWVPNYCKG